MKEIEEDMLLRRVHCQSNQVTSMGIISLQQQCWHETNTDVYQEWENGGGEKAEGEREDINIGKEWGVSGKEGPAKGD